MTVEIMPGEPRRFSDVFADLLRNFERMLRAEVRLAKSELQDEVAKASTSVLLLGAGTVLGLSAFALALVAGVAGLAQVMPAWAASLTVGALCAVAAGILVSIGRHKLAAVDLIPDRAVDRPKEDLQWLKQHTK